MKASYYVLNDGKYHLIPDDLISVVDDLSKEYLKSVDLKHIKKKKAYAIYQVWKKYDEKEKETMGEKNDT